MMKKLKVGDRVIYAHVEHSICGVLGPYGVTYPARVLRINKKTIRIELINCYPIPTFGTSAPRSPLHLSVKPSRLHYIKMVEVETSTDHTGTK